MKREREKERDTQKNYLDNLCIRIEPEENIFIVIIMLFFSLSLSPFRLLWVSNKLMVPFARLRNKPAYIPFYTILRYSFGGFSFPLFHAGQFHRNSFCYLSCVFLNVVWLVRSICSPLLYSPISLSRSLAFASDFFDSQCHSANWTGSQIQFGWMLS